MGSGIVEHYYKEMDRTNDKYKLNTEGNYKLQTKKIESQVAPQAQEPYDWRSLENKLTNLRKMALSISSEGRLQRVKKENNKSSSNRNEIAPPSAVSK
jgi:hypothetical protein